MSTQTVRVREVPGTRVHLILRNDGNPARQSEDCSLFRDGFWEVHLSSTGQHPDFRQGLWKILLVTPARPKVSFDVDDGKGLWYIAIPPTVRPVDARTTIHCFEVDGVWWQFPGFIITLSDHSEIRIQCGQEQPVQSKALN